MPSGCLVLSFLIPFPAAICAAQLQTTLEQKAFPCVFYHPLLPLNDGGNPELAASPVLILQLMQQ